MFMFGQPNPSSASPSPFRSLPIVAGATAGGSPSAMQISTTPLPTFVALLEPPLETLVVQKDAVSELICGICLQILHKPRQCKNGHLFCLDCLTQLGKSTKSPICPVCRCSMREDEVGKNIFVEKCLSSLKIHCTYHFRRSREKDSEWYEDPEGCPEIILLESKESHQNICGYRPVGCPNSTECELFRRKDFEAHLATCHFRLVHCQYCNLEASWTYMQRHETECEQGPVTCTHCSEKVKKKELEKHLSHLCVAYPIHCPFQNVGCPFSGPRLKVNEHIKQELGGHLALMKNCLDHQVQLNTELANALKTEQQKNQQLQRNSDRVIRVIWKTPRFSVQRKKTYLQSERFNFEGFTFFLGIFPEGDNEASRGYLSLYLFLDTGQVVNKSITIDFSFIIINQAELKLSFRKDFKNTFPIKGGQGWGDAKMAPSSSISPVSGFLGDDTLVIEAEFIIRRVTWVV